MAPETISKRSFRLLRGPWNAVVMRLAARPGGDGFEVLLRRIGQVLAVNVAMGGLGLVTGALAARLLNPSGRGELAAIQSWPMLFAALSLLGMPQAVVYWASRERDRAAEYQGTARALVLIAGCGLFVVGWLLMPLLLQSQSSETIRYARLYLLMIPVYALMDQPRHILRAVGAWGTWNALRLAQTALWLVVLLAAVAWPRLAAPGALVVLFLAVQGLFMPLHARVVSRHVPGPYPWSSSCCRPLLDYGVPTVLTILPQTLNLRLDQLLMASFLGPSPLGYYVVAAAWAGAAAPIFQSIGTVLMPHLSALEPSRFHRMFVAVYLPRILLLVTATTLVLFAATPMFVRLLFGSRFEPSIPAALILIVAGGFTGLNGTLAAGLQGFGKPKSVLKAEIVGLLVTVVALATLLPTFRIIGAAVASLLAYAATSLVLFLALMRLDAAPSPPKRGEGETTE